MSALPRDDRWTANEYIAWERQQSTKHELIEQKAKFVKAKDDAVMWKHACEDSQSANHKLKQQRHKLVKTLARRSPKRVRLLY